MMDYRENAGYVITDSCHVGESEFVLGVHLTAPQQFVTWKCKDRTDYYWGHYFSSLFDAQKDLVARAHEEVQYLEQRGIDPNKMELEPADSPWGEIQTCHTLCQEAKTCGFMERGYLCFEEDCAAPVALRELMDRGLYQAPVNEYFAPGEYEAVINDSLQTFHPEYWQAREKMRAEKARTPHSKTAKHKERER